MHHINQTGPPTPMNSIASASSSATNFDTERVHNTLHVENLQPEYNLSGNRTYNFNFTMGHPLRTQLQWNWIDGNGPFITNGISQHP